MLGAKKQDGTPYHPQTHFYKLPKDVLFLILQYVALPNTGQPKETQKASKVTRTTRSEGEKRIEKEITYLGECAESSSQ
jgi:hypothetical protein